MLDNKIIKKIEDFIYSQPRSVQEIAIHLDKNWRTVDRYIDEIQKSFGTISTKVFRGGTRGALKIVYWSSVEKISNSIFQEKLEEEITKIKKKEDFSSFDIFQHVSETKKKAILSSNEKVMKALGDLFLTTEKQLFIFSGNLSFINFKNEKIDMMKIIEELVKKNISIKILCRVDIVGKENVEKILSLNSKYGKEIIEIRHKEQPLRGSIIDNKLFQVKEIKEPTGKIHELKEKISISYSIKDKEWVEWLTKIFWKMFNSSVDAHKRLKELERIK